MNPIHTEGLTKHYGSFPALVDLNLDVHRGEVFGFLGPNGSGKSTTIRVLMGELSPTSGSATVLGASPREVVHRQRLGYLPPDLALWPAMTGHDTLKFFAKLRHGAAKGSEGNVDWSYVMQLTERLDATLDKRVGELSTGNRQKIGLIQAFMHKPDLLILDEPNAGLDPLVQHEFWAMMREVADDGRTVFLSSHTLAEVERVADRVGIIRKGQLVTVEQVSELRRKRMRRIKIEFAPKAGTGTPLTKQDLAAVSGIHDLEIHAERIELNFDGDLPQLLAAVTARVPLLDIHTQEAELEDIFLAYYQDES